MSESQDSSIEIDPAALMSMVAPIMGRVAAMVYEELKKIYGKQADTLTTVGMAAYSKVVLDEVHRRFEPIHQKMLDELHAECVAHLSEGVRKASAMRAQLMQKPDGQKH